MHFSIQLLIASLLAGLAAARNTITFQNMDGRSRYVYFTANAGKPYIGPLYVPAGPPTWIEIPWGWAGMWKAIPVGMPNRPGMLGEITFQGFEGKTFFDVSAIDDPGDRDGVYKLYPTLDPANNSGCDTWPCANAYFLPNDLQTKVTPYTDMTCTLGSAYRNSKRGPNDKRQPKNVEHKYVLGEGAESFEAQKHVVEEEQA